MISLLAAWGIASASEILLYHYTPNTSARRIWVASISFVIFVSATILLLSHPAVWLPLWVLNFYRILNLARMYKGRLNKKELQRSSLRALILLLLAQFGFSGLFWIMIHFHGFALYVIDGIVTLQLLAALVILRVSLNTWKHTYPNLSTKNLADKDLPSVSVLVPARNETDELQQCLSALVGSDYPKLEIIVLDDCSVVRRTPEIIRGFAHDGVRFIAGSVPDERRWLPKNWAYSRLSEEASGELLLFCGVDVIFEPESIRRLVEIQSEKKKDMVSILPSRAQSAWPQGSLFQPMRYFWEICLPRRFFKRPPVLSTCWMIRKTLLEQSGSFTAVSRSVTPEAHFARQSVINDGYSFIRSDNILGISSTKPAAEQYDTTVRMRYPQLHRRLELVALTSMFELIFLFGPLLGLFVAPFLPHAALYGSIWLAIQIMLTRTYYLVAVRTRLNSAAMAWFLYPVAIAADVIMLHVSLLKYEFGTVDWKGRNVCLPVMRVEAQLPSMQKQ